MYPILEAKKLADKIYLMVVKAPRISANCKPGEFVIVKMDEKGERIPITIHDYDREKGTVTEEYYREVAKGLLELPAVLEDVLGLGDRIADLSKIFTYAHNFIYLGRGYNYPTALEGALKLKEISYIHSEAYAAGELKHGTISLIEDGTLVIGILTQSDLYEKTVSNMVECKSRGAYLMGLTTYGKYETEDQVNFMVYVPKVDEHFIGSLAVIPLQLLGYYVSVAKGLDVDKPRNLAKSVTVE